MNIKNKRWPGGFLFLMSCMFIFSIVHAQEQRIKSKQYQIGPNERLMITVHVFGEVRRPGEYLVPDDTNILELISKAGGPTEFSDMSDVRITRGLIGVTDYKKALTNKELRKKYRIRGYRKKVIKVNLKKILDKEKYSATLATLQPGDVVRVGRNAWFTWQAVIRIISQLAIVAQVWYWYNRVD